MNLEDTNEEIKEESKENIQDFTKIEDNKKDNNEQEITLDSELNLPKKQIKISLTTFIFIIMFCIVMILAGIEGLIYINFTGI